MKKILVCAAMLGAVALHAENLVVNGDGSGKLANWSPNQVLFIEEDGQKFFQTTTHRADHRQLIEVEPDVTYKVSCRMRALPGKSAKPLFGFRLLDKDKKVIASEQLLAFPATATELAADCKPGDKVLKVKDASKIVVKDKFNLIAFDVKADFSDLPNRNLTKGIITKVAKVGDIWEITLNKPCGISRPAGTAVRQHRYSAALLYPFRKACILEGDQWKSFSGTVRGKVVRGISHDKFWPGTKYMQVVIAPGRNGIVQFDDIVIEKVVK